MWAGRLAASLSPSARSVARRPNAWSSSGTGGASSLYELVRGDDDDEAIGCRSDDLLACLRSAAALHEPAVSRNLVGSVNGDVEAVERVEGVERQAELARGVLCLERRRNATMSSRRAASAGRK